MSGPASGSEGGDQDGLGAVSVFTEREHVRARPAMSIGGTGPRGLVPDSRLVPSGEDCRAGLALAVAVRLQEARFDGPMKEKLSNPDGRNVRSRVLAARDARRRRSSSWAMARKWLGEDRLKPGLQQQAPVGAPASAGLPCPRSAAKPRPLRRSQPARLSKR
jgi:hypothetical protein